MPRPRKPRTCGCQKGCHGLRPTGVPMSMVEVSTLEADELEALRLCDLEGLTQEEAGERMGVSRGTVQRTVKAGRAKIVEAIVLGKAIFINDSTEDGSQ